MKTVAIGVHAHEQPERLRATLESLRAHTAGDADLVLLPDGPDPATQEALQSLTRFPQHPTGEARGAPACFNRLCRATSADVVVLLESGSIVGRDWLELLLAALDADPRHGLAGPSTNRSWNEQGAFPGRGEPDGTATAAEARRRYGGQWRTLEPLYSLADFCYAVRREVVDAIGEADERYGTGPCWEMDYNIRAARAGWHGVWACGAFVWRSPFTSRRERDERRRLEANKRLYQDKFCARRLRGERAAYEPHCRGAACEHFAPPTLIEMRRRPGAAPSPGPRASRAVSASVEPEPLASCIMPTRDRAELALQAVRYFQRQDYAARELIILDDGTQDLGSLLPDDERIRYVRMEPGRSIGAKRNLGVELARGDFIVHWDDDDWFAPARLRVQLEPLRRDQADISGLTTGLFFDLPEWTFWRCSPELHARMFVHDVHGGTLAYRRRIWVEGVRFPAISLAEDAYFLRDAVRRGARLTRRAGHDLFLYLRHEGNSWRFGCGTHVDPRGWTRAPEPALPAGDRAFYAARSPRAPAPPAGQPAVDGPLVTCIMPTADRPRFAQRAIDYFLRQDYAARELVIADDGAEPIGHLVPPDARIRYLRLAGHRPLGEKRNIACDAAHGELIAHWDDDDWMAPHRLSLQVAAMREHPATLLNGLAELFFYEPATRRAWRYVYGQGPAWVAGNTLCYRRTLWERNRFPAVAEGEDTRFVWSMDPAAVLALPDPAFFVGMVHGGNTSPKRTQDARWRALHPEQVRALLGPDLSFYDALVPAPPAPVVLAAPVATATRRAVASRG